jgi:hypothetical protein
MDTEAWIMALEIAADAIYRQDISDMGEIREDDWHSGAMRKAYLAIRKEISRLENNLAAGD